MPKSKAEQSIAGERLLNTYFKTVITEKYTRRPLLLNTWQKAVRAFNSTLYSVSIQLHLRVKNFVDKPFYGLIKKDKRLKLLHVTAECVTKWDNAKSSDLSLSFSRAEDLLESPPTAVHSRRLLHYFTLRSAPLTAALPVQPAHTLT